MAQKESMSVSPKTSDIKEARFLAGLTQTQAAHLVHSALRSWQQWEAGDRQMHPGLWELFKLKSVLIERKSPNG